MCCAERRGPPRFPLATRAARTPDATALAFRGEASTHAFPADPLTLSFRELDLATTAVARGLLARGVRPGERVGLRLAPGPGYPLLLLALLRAGAVAAPVSTRIPEAAVPVLLGGIGCRRLIAASDTVSGATDGIDLVDAAELLRTSSAASPGGPATLPLPPFDPRADATIVFTSGSTGVPKAALHSFENHRASAAGANRNVPLRPGDRWLLSLPPWHVGGLSVVFRCVLGGAAIAVAGTREPLADAIAGLGATHLSLVATQLYRLLHEKRGRAALRGLKAVLLGGGPAPAGLIAEAVRAGVRLVTSYGSTEMSSQATATRPGDPAESLSTAGRPLLFREIAVAADGEILVRGRTCFRGYVEATRVRPARDGAGWFHTGDLGCLDDAGRLIVTGRRDAMFISGGENIHPEEIEREILRFPGALEAIVVPVPDPEFGARPVAFLRMSGGGMPGAGVLERSLRESLPGFKIPVRVLPWPDLEEGMKPDRRSLATRAAGLVRGAPP